MGRDVCDASPAAREVFDAADAALGFPLAKLCFEGPEDALTPTEVQQPAILTTSVALLRALRERAAVEPAFVGGHSLGEYSALVAAGAVSFEDAVRLVHARGRFMQEAVPAGRGAMAAVLGLDPAEIQRVCEQVAAESSGCVTPANFNSPQQTVIAGDAASVELACERLKEAGAKRTIALKVSAPFHCALMEPAASRLEHELAAIDFADARPPVVSNVEARPCSEGARFPALLREQVTAPVRFTEMIAALEEQGVTHYLEIGPGQVLSGLLARIQRRSRRANLTSSSDLDAVVDFVAESSGGGPDGPRG